MVFPDFVEKELEKKPILLVDIGASGGMQDIWKKVRNLQVVGFEPDERAYENIKDMKCLNCMLDSEKREVTFYLTRNQGVSSLYEPNREFLNKFPESDRFDIIKEKRMICDTLDDQLNKNSISDVDFIKLDTQGSELRILHGAKKTLDSVFGIEIEVEFNPMYKDQALFSDVDIFLREHGFQLFDLSPHYWKRKRGMKFGKQKGQLIFADALYFRKNIQGDKSKILRAISICLLYGYVDYAFEIFEDNKKIFSNEEQNMLYGFFNKTSRNIPNVRGMGRVASVLEDISFQLKPNYKGWAKSGKLGNI